MERNGLCSTSLGDHGKVIFVDELRSNDLEREFKAVYYQKRLPVVLKGLNIGRCRELWTWSYLRQKCHHHKVKIHVSPDAKMDFITKNFAYKTIEFGDFLDRVENTEQEHPFFCKNEKYYLRSISTADARKQVADITKDFPEVSDDIRFPDLFESERYFSSVFRIASEGLQLWTHYDVLDNMLIVVSGRKRVVLFDPSDALNLYLKDDKSEVLDIDNPDLERFPRFTTATRYECLLEPGDVLFIPALWFHNVLNQESGVAVNVFWRHLDAGEYDATDTYGNKDLSAAARAEQVLDRALKQLDALPQDGGYRDFYAKKLLQKIASRYDIKL